MPNPEKIKAVEDLRGLFKDAKGYYLADFTGMNAHEITEIRRRFRKENIRFRVAKNTLVRIVLAELEHKDILDCLVGPNAFVITYEDELAPPRIMKGFEKDYSKGKLRLAYIDGKVLNEDELGRIANLPSTQQIRANLVGALQSPIYGLIWGLKGLLTSLVVTLSQIAKSREEEK